MNLWHTVTSKHKSNLQNEIKKNQNIERLQHHTFNRPPPTETMEQNNLLSNYYLKIIICGSGVQSHLLKCLSQNHENQSFDAQLSGKF